jgi:hypothetical protein
MDVHHRLRETRSAPAHLVATATTRDSKVYIVHLIEVQAQDVILEGLRSDCDCRHYSPPSWKWHVRSAGTLTGARDCEMSRIRRVTLI